MQFFNLVTNSGSPSTSTLIFVMIIYSAPTWFLTDIQGVVTELSCESTYLISWPLHREPHFMLYGTFTHFSLVAQSYMKRKFPGRRIGESGPIAWPPHSRDLNPLDFYLWDHLKSFICSSTLNDVKTLQNQIVAGSQTILTVPGIWNCFCVQWDIKLSPVSCRSWA